MITLGELANLIGAELTHSPEITVQGINSLEKATEQEISFIDSEKMLEKMGESQACAFIVSLKIQENSRPLLRTVNPRLAWAKTLEYFDSRPKAKPFIHQTAVLGAGVELGKNVSLGPGVVVGDKAVIGDNTVLAAQVCIGAGSKVGEDCFFHPRVVVEDGVVIGNKVIIQAGAIIGSDGFGFVTIAPGQHYKIPHVGGVVIEDEVEIGANVCIDRGTMGCTLVKKGSKIDNLVHLGHNVQVGEGCLLVAQVGVSGSTTIGNRVIMAGQVGTVGHITIGEDTVLAARTGVTGNIPPASFYSGFPARPHREQLKKDATVQKLPETMKKIKQIEKRIAHLEESR